MDTPKKPGSMELVAAVKAHARANYSTDGWDVVIEAWDVADLIDEIGDATTVAQALERVGKTVKTQHEFAEDIKAEAF